MSTIMESSKKKTKWYNQTFKTEWLKDPDFKYWLEQDKDNVKASFCKYCKFSLKNANRSALIKHKNSVRHNTNFERTKSNIGLKRWVQTNNNYNNTSNISITPFLPKSQCTKTEQISKGNTGIAGYFTVHNIPFVQAGRFVGGSNKTEHKYTIMSSVARNIKNVGKFTPNCTALFLCDMQEKFRTSIQYFPQIIEISNRLLRSFKILDLPIICTEQYPKGLGSTVPELGIEEHGIKAIDKTQFSMCLPSITEQLEEKQIKSVVICGIEAHVCVQQTTLDLIEAGYDVHIIADAVSSRSMVDRMYALERMKNAGAFLTTSESAILCIAGGSKHPKFRELQKVIWTSAPDTGLLTNREVPKAAM